MADQATISPIGLVYLKNILFVRDLVDYYDFLKKDGISLFSQESALIDQFNRIPADVAAANGLFGLNLDPADPQLKASQLAAAALRDPSSATDLKAALALLDSRAGKAFSIPGKAILKKILYIRDFLDYFRFLLGGDKGHPSPLSGDLLAALRGPDKFKLGPEIFGKLVARFNANPHDVTRALTLLGLKAKVGVPVTVRDFAFTGKVFPALEHDIILKQKLCLIDPAECPAKEPTEPPPAVIAPAPEPKPVVTSADNQKLLERAGNLAQNGKFADADKALKEVAWGGLSAADKKSFINFRVGISAFFEAQEDEKKGDLVGAQISYDQAERFIPEAGAFIDIARGQLRKKIAAANAARTPAPSPQPTPKAAVPNPPSINILPQDPSQVARAIGQELKNKLRGLMTDT